MRSNSNKPQFIYEREKTVAFTGYRASKLRDRIPVRMPQIIVNLTILQRLCHTVEYLYEEGYDTFLCGMADGFDVIAGYSVIRMKEFYPQLRLVAVQPFQAQSCEPEYLWLRNAIYSRASHIEYISKEFFKGVYHKRNDFLIEHSSALICYYDGDSGGTKYTVTKALQRDHSILNMCASETGKTFNRGYDIKYNRASHLLQISKLNIHETSNT